MDFISDRLCDVVFWFSEPFIDIADVAVSALTDSRHDGELYEVTGPELMIFRDIAKRLSQATGRPIRYTPITIDEFHHGLINSGVPENFASLIRYLFELTATGVNARVSEGVERVLSRAPRSFDSYACGAVDQGLWSTRAALA